MEIHGQCQFPKGQEITSIYFGGGTPSLLNENDLDKLLSALKENFTWHPDIEFTLEANPDDIDTAHCRMWKKKGINRLSIGIQSFSEKHLMFMNRAHSKKQAMECIDIVQDEGFYNLTCDVIYGLPDSASVELEKDIEYLIHKNIPHISAYALTVEEKTLLHHQVKTKVVAEPDENIMEEQFFLLMDLLTSRGYEHYEISNFAKPGFHARHNSQYWQGDTYLGIGPSAHSFDGKVRRWNISNNALYMKSVQLGTISCEKETLHTDDQYNEYVMTGLRTIWGVNQEKLRVFGPSYEEYFLKGVNEFIQRGQIVKLGNTWTLTREGKLFADRIASQLFYM
jgi:oxygen-independent coproporphyrinogen-3 oxidase